MHRFLGRFARHWRTRLDPRVMLLRLARNQQFILALLAVVVGLAAGVGAILFRLGIGAVQWIYYGSATELITTHLASVPWWGVLFGPALGGLLVGLYSKRFLDDQGPHGLRHVIETSAVRGGRMSLRDGLRSAVGNILTIGSGASVGREGPLVHLGASLGAWPAKYLRLNRPQSRTLLGCGVAGAVAASFNAPIAGSLFALEVVIGHYALSAFAPIVLAAVTGTIVSRLYFGNFPAFTLPDFAIASALEFPAFALLGVICALVAVGLMLSIEIIQKRSEGLPGPIWIRPMLAGFAVGLIALVFPQVIGVGYEATDVALTGGYGFWMLAALVPVKILATALCVGLRFGSGLFTPSLFLGAMVGCAFGVLATAVFPQLSSGYAAYGIVGMGAVAGAVMGAPISTILMVFEMTGDYAVTIAVMMATVIATVISTQIYGRSFFVRQLSRAGVNLHEGYEAGLLRQLSVRDAMRRDYSVVLTDSAAADVRAALPAAPSGVLFVVDLDGRLHGMIDVRDLGMDAMGVEGLEEPRAIDIAHRPISVVEQDATLGHAVAMLSQPHETIIPVIDHVKDRRLVGFLTELDVTRTHNACLLQARAEERGDA